MLHKSMSATATIEFIGFVTSGFANGDSVICDSDGSILGRSNGEYNNTRDASANIKHNSSVPRYLFP